MTKKEQINKRLEEIYPQLEINCKKVCGYGYPHWGENLLAHSIQSFLQMDIDKQYRIMVEDDAGENYITSGMAISVKSNTSSFFRIYRRELYQSREILEINYDEYNTNLDLDPSKEKIECLSKAVKQLDYYDKHLITEHYYKSVSVAELGRQLNIQPARLTADIRIALLKLKKICK